MRIAVVIPAYNEAVTIAGVVERTLAHTGDVVVVDDGSSDGTAAALAHLPITLVRNETNLGKAASLARGFAAIREMGADAVITLDGDGQHPPEAIPRLVEAAGAHPGDIVVAARLRDRDQMPRARRFGNRQADFWISWAAGYPIRDTQSGYRLYPMALLERLDLPARPGGFVFESEVLIEAARLGSFVRSVPIETIYGESPRESHYRAGADTSRIVVMVAGKLLKRGLFPLGLARALGLLPHPGRSGGGAHRKSPGAMN